MTLSERYLKISREHPFRISGHLERIWNIFIVY